MQMLSNLMYILWLPGLVTFGIDHGNCGRLSIISLEKSLKSMLFSNRIASVSPSISPALPRLRIRLLHGTITMEYIHVNVCCEYVNIMHIKRLGTPSAIKYSPCMSPTGKSVFDGHPNGNNPPVWHSWYQQLQYSVTNKTVNKILTNPVGNGEYSGQSSIWQMKRHDSYFPEFFG